MQLIVMYLSQIIAWSIPTDLNTAQSFAGIVGPLVAPHSVMEVLGSLSHLGHAHFVVNAHIKVRLYAYIATEKKGEGIKIYVFKTKLKKGNLGSK